MASAAPAILGGPLDVGDEVGWVCGEFDSWADGYFNRDYCAPSQGVTVARDYGVPSQGVTVARLQALPVAEPEGAEDARRRHRERAQVLFPSDGPRVQRDHFRLAASNPGPSVSPNWEWAAGFRDLLVGGGRRGLPDGVYEKALARGCLCQMEGRLPRPGTSAIEHGMAVIREQMRRAPSLRFYIGISEAPVERWMGHFGGGRGRHADLFDMMVVIEEATSSTDTAQTERELIARTSATFGPQCLNRGPGGEGASSGSPHYTYIVFKYGATGAR